MSFYNFGLISNSFLQVDGLPFSEILSEETVNRVAEEAGVSPPPLPAPPPPPSPLPSPATEGTNSGTNSDTKSDATIYTRAVTLWGFLSQVIHKGPQRCCVAAVARVAVLCAALGRPLPSPDTGAYCRARKRLPLVLVQRLTYHVADAAEGQVPEAWLWKGRHVRLVDGTTVSTPDTPELQAKFPQPKSQKPGLGAPIIRLVVLMSLATAMLTGMAMGPYTGKETGETALFRQLLDRLKAGDVVLADRYFCSYFMCAILRALGVDVVTRLHQRRTADFRRGRRLGHGDHVVTWLRPARPSWMDQETYDRMPASMEVREVQVQVHQPGFRVNSLIVVTSLLDAETYTREDIAELYHQRWHVELDIEAIKVRLGMDELRCKTPALVEKEIWTCVLAYNLIRLTMLQAALKAKLSPRQLSFASALEAIAPSYGVILALDDTKARTLVEALLGGLATHLVGNRPGRVEPRAIKRRPKPHRLLTVPRAEARAQLLAGTRDQ